MAPITISRYENGLREPSIDTLLTLSSYFDISTDKLIGGASPESLEERELLTLFYSLNNSGKELLIHQAKFYSTMEQYTQREDGKILLVTGTSLSLFGGITLRTEGHALEGLHIISSGFREREYVYGGDLYYTAVYNHVEMEIYGSQIRMTDQITGLSANEQAFGHIIYGSSCKGTPGKEGVIINNSIFTNTLGPLLVLNPWLTKEMINVALKNKGESFRIEEPDMSLEKKSLEAKKRFASKAYAQQPQAL